MYILGEYFSDLAFNKICFWHFIACLNQQREGGIRDLVLLLRHQRKRNTIVNSRTSGKNLTTGYSQVRWEMIWRFALLCSSNFSVASGGLYDIKRHSETSLHKKAVTATNKTPQYEVTFEQ